MDPNQIPTRYICPGPIILSRSLSSLSWHRNQYPLKWNPTKYMRHLSGIIRSPSGLKHLCCQTPIDFSNRFRGRPDYLQLTPWLPEILSIDARAVKPRVAAPPGLSEIFTPGLLPTRWLEALAVWILWLLSCLFSMSVWHAHPFTLK